MGATGTLDEEEFPTKTGFQAHVGLHKKTGVAASAPTANSRIHAQCAQEIIPQTITATLPQQVVQEATPQAATQMQVADPIQAQEEAGGGVITPIDSMRLGQYLEGYQGRDYLVHGFQAGFRIGFCGIREERHADNHSSVAKNPDIIRDKIVKELALKRVQGPFNTAPFPNLQVSPLGLIPKKDGDFRVIHDLSFPNKEGINCDIPQEFSKVQYETLDCVLDLVRNCGRGALIAKTDIENAFRVIPIHHDDHELLGFCWNGQYYYDCCLPQGCSSSCKIFEDFSSALQWIMARHFEVHSMTHILDDFIFVNSPKSHACRRDLSKFLALAKELGIPIKKEKTYEPSTKAVVHGVHVDTVSMTISLPEDKLSTLATLLNNFSSRKKVTLKELQCLIGHLNFACIVVRPGRAFLRRLIDRTMGVKKPHHKIKLTKEARADIAAWKLFIEHFNGSSILMHEAWLSSDKIRLYTDAAGSKGFAAVLGSRWCYGAWPSEWRDLPTATLELFPITLAMQMWGHLLANHKVLFMCDNESTVAIVNKQSSRDKCIMKMVRKLVVTCMSHNVFFRAKHVSGVTNVVADRLSRFQVKQARKYAPWLNKDPDTIPESLLPWKKL